MKQRGTVYTYRMMCVCFCPQVYVQCYCPVYFDLLSMCVWLSEFVLIFQYMHTCSICCCFMLARTIDQTINNCKNKVCKNVI